MYIRPQGPPFRLQRPCRVCDFARSWADPFGGFDRPHQRRLHVGHCQDLPLQMVVVELHNIRALLERERILIGRLMLERSRARKCSDSGAEGIERECAKRVRYLGDAFTPEQGRLSPSLPLLRHPHHAVASLTYALQHPDRAIRLRLLPSAEVTGHV